MYRTRIQGRTRYTSSYAHLSTKLNKNSLCGISDHAKRSARGPRALKRTECGRRVVSTVDMCAFSSAIRGAATSQPLFYKTGVMRYDPLKKNVVRPFRALFNFVFGIVRGVVHSALTLGTSPLYVMFPIGRLLTNHKTHSLKSQLKSQPKAALSRSISTQSVPALASHPLRCFKRTPSQHPLKASAHHRRGKSQIVEGSSKEIADVLKAYNTSESRDRLITKLKDMKSGAAECIKSLSQRNLEQQSSLTRRELLMCKQEMVHLSKQLSGPTAERRSQSRNCRRSVSALERPAAVSSSQTLSRTVTFDHSALRPQSQPSKRISLESLTECVKEVKLKTKETPSAPTRSESLRMKLKQHEHMVDTLKSKYAALSHSRDRGGRNA